MSKGDLSVAKKISVLYSTPIIDTNKKKEYNENNFIRFLRGRVQFPTGGSRVY
jgi:hypothetical protein